MADPQHEVRPWGQFWVLDDGEQAKVKRLEIAPGGACRTNARRAEHWQMVEGEGLVTLDGRDFAVKAGDAVDVAKGVAHRIANPGTTPLVFVEVQAGEYFGEDDMAPRRRLRARLTRRESLRIAGEPGAERRDDPQRAARQPRNAASHRNRTSGISSKPSPCQQALLAGQSDRRRGAAPRAGRRGNRRVWAAEAGWDWTAATSVLISLADW